MSLRVFYIAYYDVPGDNSENRNCRLSATNKINYISSVLNQIDHDVQIVSACTTKDRRFVKKERKQVNSRTCVQLFASIGNLGKLSRFIDRKLMFLQMVTYLCRNVKKNDIIIVYHSTGYFKLIEILKKIKCVKVVLEVEEIYGDVCGNEKMTKKELKFFRLADQYIFPTKLLDKKVNTAHKPSTIIHGTYQVEPEKMAKEDYYQLHGWDSDRYHIVYAGTLDPRKGGAIAAASAAEFLPAQYHVHILGFGSDSDLQRMKDLVADISAKTDCKITYDGLLSGDDYTRFIQSCHIGLSTQNPDAAFNDTSFPSKILSYMANGLRVVSIRIPAVEQSAIGEDMFYYDHQTPQEIAEAIQKVDFSKPYDSREKISRLDKQFKADIVHLLQH